MPDEDRDRHKAFERTVQGKAARKIRARRNRERGIWFSLGMMGLVGWSVTLPAVLGAFVGRWLDHRWDGGNPIAHEWSSSCRRHSDRESQRLRPRVYPS